MLLNANNRQRYCVRVSNQCLSLSLLKHAMWAWLVFATSGAWFNGCGLNSGSGFRFKWAQSNSWQSNFDADFWASVCSIKSVLYALGFNAFFVPKNMCKILGLNKQWL